VGVEGGSDQRQQVPADAVVVVAVMPWLWSRPSARPLVRSSVRPCGPCLPLLAMMGGDVVGNDGGHGWYLSSVGWDLYIIMGDGMLLISCWTDGRGPEVGGRRSKQGWM
jgi:hypothetical protein